MRCAKKVVSEAGVLEDGCANFKERNPTLKRILSSFVNSFHSENVDYERFKLRANMSTERIPFKVF